MAEQKGIDVLMQVVVTSKGLVMENQTDFAPLAEGDPLVKDFIPGQFCELREFDFSAGVESMVKKDEPKQKTPPPEPSPNITTAVLQTHRDRYQKREKKEFVDMLPVSFTRLMDVASPLLFDALITCTTLVSISIVKRKAAGSVVSGLGYLRLDFQDVLLTSLDWKDSEHVMIETGTFIYRKLDIQYLSQKADGSLEPGSSATWKMQTTRTKS